MKTFNATELNKSAAKVFREADINGSVKINHDRYPDKVFVLESRARRIDVETCEHKNRSGKSCDDCGLPLY